MKVQLNNWVGFETDEVADAKAAGLGLAAFTQTEESGPFELFKEVLSGACRQQIELTAKGEKENFERNQGIMLGLDLAWNLWVALRETSRPKPREVTEGEAK